MLWVGPQSSREVSEIGSYAPDPLINLGVEGEVFSDG